ncbi:tagatose 1,6-diphosphate aldolase [Acuticoccus sp. MNP-M23]|uniref:tagatose 1,6-diphosphate aldolase n=1 Tax=Acuticoccus sp. MNP-M23 TaxID=3072793 RepID=UPI0028152E36|nr:tagatose 1,6-diphosphate aldolase [Acuticoccus sp. MNP-M23]WMS43573.1 tagatose 1,6-diphosphate aldolase [Acuticoccus sp. MNP-M23]
MLTLGKLRGLDSMAAANGTYSMLALDHRNSFAQLTAEMFSGNATWEQVVAEKERLARAMAGHATAVLMDPLFTAGPLVASGAIPGAIGVVVAVERSGFDKSDGGRLNVLEPGWTVDAVKRMGADGVKLLVQYHPSEAAASAQEDFVGKVADACRDADIALVLEPISYAPSGKKTDPAFKEALPGLVAQIAKTFDPYADILKLEYPLLDDAPFEDMVAACQAVTDATRLPWVVLSGGVPFEDFMMQVRAACEGGASGFLGGRAIWKEAMNILDVDGRDDFLRRTAGPRIAALRAISDASATPWRDRPVAREATRMVDGWHGTYAGGNQG